MSRTNPLMYYSSEACVRRSKYIVVGCITNATVLSISIKICSLLSCHSSTLDMNFERLHKCEDDRNWRDTLHGDGKDSCDSMNPDFCTNHGEYSIEAKRACPRACGVCSYGNTRFW